MHRGVNQRTRGANAGTYAPEVAGLVYVDPTDMRSEEDQLAYYKARGHAAEDIPALKARNRARFATVQRRICGA